MTKDYAKVAVDTAFFLKITENDDGHLFRNIMKQMERTPVVHEFVFEQELVGHLIACKFVEDGIIQVITYGDFLKDELDKEQYDFLFRQAYKGMNGSHLKADDIFAYRHSCENLGEIHTALMAQHMRIDLMVSDDKGAKKYIENNMSSGRHALSVQNIPDVLISLAYMDRSYVKWADIKGLAKSLYGHGKQYDVIRGHWVNTDSCVITGRTR